MFIDKYPLKANSVIIAPMAQKFYFPEVFKLPYATLQGMYHLAEYTGVPKNTVRATLSRMCKAGEVESFTDEAGTVRYKMSGMMNLIAGQAALFAKSEGFTLAVFNFKKENEKERYRIREILGAFGFRKLAQNVYLNIKIDSAALMEQMKEWQLQDNLYLFDCQDIKDPGMLKRIGEIWELDKWNEKLREFYEDLKEYFNFEGFSDEEIYNRYSYGYSTFFVYFYEKHPSVPQSFLTEEYFLGKVTGLLESTIQIYGEQITRHYKKVNG